ncbi:glycine C-acetyltransferase [Vampirovibrio chlorellavorus]|uniref:glycine C-acetyltransferase n=1 Tax=Vampirovibrio chlorellavorus TaxID=758823 RepID=UPI0026EE257E|nr:glycine C-acetyltransferase [Vampirovibrio chlorellavorus]
MTASTEKKSHRLDFLKDEIQRLKDEHLYQALQPFEGPQDAELSMNGRQILNFSSNNYLGLANHPKLIEAAIQATRELGVGAGAVRTIIGTMGIHEQLEEKLARFKHCEATLVLQSGFTANMAAIPPIMGEGDVIISDALNHASIIDAVRLSRGASKDIYAHSDMNALESVLKKHKTARRRLIVTDGVFSMDGDIAKLPDIVSLAEQYNAIVMVDDAHGSGVLGSHGRGTVDHFGLHDQVDIVVGTMSKALGSMGGYVASTQAMREIMVNKARPLLFSTPHPPSVVAACLAAIELLEADDALIQKLWFNTRYFKAGMKSIGLPIDSETPLCPVIVGTSEKAQKLSQRLLEEGIYGRAIVFPTVAADKARVRVIINACHTQAHLDRCIEAFEKIGKELGLLQR